MTPESASSLSSNDKGPAEPGPGSGDGCPANLSPNPGVEERSELYGLTFLNKQQFGDVAEAKEAQYPVDIVAIPGIGGDDYKTWTHSDGKFWLRDFLPGQLPGARVFTFSYPSEVAFALETGQLRDCARTLLVGLNSVRQTAEELSRPIILVCHSVGGFVAKQALVAAEDYANIRDSVVGILFLGTPHRGSSTTQFPEVLTRITDVALADSPRFTDKMRKDLFESLEKGSDILKTISTEFKNQVSNIRIVSFIEQNTIPPSKQRVVDEISGTMDVPKETIVPMDGYDHRDICRFEDYTSSGYQTVFSRLEKLAGG
ncbi:MAG: hypothetical protein M1839_004625 [Geoglossum umbratile]|nr:MAG: hypothetical protein M1839_004625 [Geoglossum umbratile]